MRKFYQNELIFLSDQTGPVFFFLFPVICLIFTFNANKHISYSDVYRMSSCIYKEVGGISHNILFEIFCVMGSAHICDSS